MQAEMLLLTEFRPAKVLEQDSELPRAHRKAVPTPADTLS